MNPNDPTDVGTGMSLCTFVIPPRLIMCLIFPMFGKLSLGVGSQHRKRVSTGKESAVEGRHSCGRRGNLVDKEE